MGCVRIQVEHLLLAADETGLLSFPLRGDGEKCISLRVFDIASAVVRIGG